MNIHHLIAANVPDLDWLNVDENDYRELDRLPKQNLDVIPDLQAAWTHTGQAATAFIPNRGDAPRTMGDLSQEHGLLRAAPEDIRRVARLAAMQDPSLQKIQHTLLQRFDRDSLKEARTLLAEVLAERGLLGGYYIAAADFPGCGAGSSKAAAFVKKYAADARFVQAKKECYGCVHAHALPNGTSTCSVFHKQIQVEVPYTEALAEQVEQSEQAKGKSLVASVQDPKARVKAALLARPQQIEPMRPIHAQENTERLLRQGGAEAFVLPVDLTAVRGQAHAAVTAALQQGRLPVPIAQSAFRMIRQATTAEQIQEVQKAAEKGQAVPVSVYQGAGNAPPAAAPVTATEVQAQIISAANLTRKRDEAARLATSEAQARPIVAALRREMLKGRPERDLLATLRKIASPEDLEATRGHWEPLFRQAGLYGVLYVTQESFTNCRTGAAFVSAHGQGIRAIVAGSRCGECVYNKLFQCQVYGKPLVATAEELFTPEMVEQVYQGHKMAGRIAPGDTRLAQAGSPREALQNLHRAAAVRPGATMGASRDQVETAFRGDVRAHGTRTDVQRSIVASTRRHLNQGVYGTELLRRLKAQYDARDLAAVQGELREVLAEQGLQGVYFLDPTVYQDYGKGCKEAARLHRGGQVPYVKMASKCASCVHQTEPGMCSVLNKPLVEQVPYPGDPAQLQKAALAGPVVAPVSSADLVNNGAKMMAEYEMPRGGMTLELDPEPASAGLLSISFGGGGDL